MILKILKKVILCLDHRPIGFKYLKNNNNNINMDSNGSNFNIYTDGACTNNGRKGSKCSIGIHFPENNEIKLEDISRVLKVPKPTNNVAELTAILESMKKVKGIVYTPICIYTDSEYSLNVLTKWYPKWTEKDKESKKNVLLIKETYDLYVQLPVYLFHIKAHTNLKDEHSIGNAMADKLATYALQNKFEIGGGNILKYFE